VAAAEVVPVAMDAEAAAAAGSESELLAVQAAAVVPAAVCPGDSAACARCHGPAGGG